MSSRPTWFRFVIAICVFTCVSFAVAAVGPRFYPGLFSATATSNESSFVQTTSSAPLTIGTCDTAGPIEVESTGGTTAPTAYATLKAAFDAIIAGTHTGSIAVEVCGNTTEAATAALTASGVGSASYTDVTIRPVGGARIIEGTIVGAIVRLQGADNVTIDGRQGGTGSARDLTIRNNSTATATAAVWLSSVAAGNGASNNVIRNLEVAAGQTANAGTNTTIGIFMGPSTISLSGTDGNDNDNNQFLFNRVTRARYGIATRGVTTNNHEGLVIADNIVGPTSFGADEIGKAGIYLQADTGAIVTRNTVQFVGGDLANTTAGADRCGICVGGESWGVTESTTITSGSYSVTRNIIHDIVEERTFSSIGIRLGTTRSGSATNNVVANNFIYNLRADGTASDQVVGIGYAAGHTDQIVFNSISITGDQDPGTATASATYGNAIRVSTINGTNNVNLTLMDNSIYLDASSSSTAANRYYAITLPSNAYVFGTGGLNYNNYYIVPTNTQLQTGGLGTNTGNTITTQFAALADWQAALTTPQDANSKQANPLHFSNTGDLHLTSISPNIDMGVAIAGITDDVDGQTRPNGAAVDIGADEFYPAPGSVQLSSATYSATEVSGLATITVTRTGGASGAVSVNYATSDGSATGGGSCGAGVDYVTTSGTLNWADNETAAKTFTVTLCNDGVAEGSETVNITLSAPTGGVTIGTPSAAVLTILNSTTFGGTTNVGSAEAITSLTNPGGLFEQINNGTLGSNLLVNITSDLTAETGAVALNQFSGGTLTIQPSGGAARLIAGGNATALLDFNGADGVTIDGLNTGGNTLTIRSTSTGSAVRYINDASSNMLTRTILEANANSSVVYISTGVTTGNDNNSIVANTITGRSDAAGAPFNSINLIGTSAAISNTNTLINNNTIVNFLQAAIVIGTSDNVTYTNNDISQTVSRTTSLFGVAINSAGGTNVISGNTVHDLTTTLNVTGFAFNDARDTLVSRNRVYNIPSTAASTGVLTGILFNGSSGNPATVTAVNNMVSIVPAFTNNQVIYGIRDFAFAGNTFSSYYNTVLIGGTATSTSNTYACQRGFSAPTAYTSINNLCFNNRTGGTGNHFAAGDQSSNTGTFVSNYNIFVGTGATAANMFDKATSSTAVPVDFATWQAGPPTRDANSQASNPGVGNYTVANMFVSTTDLHLANEGTNPASNAGTPVMGVTTDFDGNTRSGTTPEIGFDEFFTALPGTIAFSSATYMIGEAGASATITVNRTGGSDGTVTADYSLGGGTATGGAACGGAVDYVNTGGTVTFLNGETSKSFNVTICNDTVFEGNETFDATLSNPTGGATIGSPNPATVTITDDKGQPTVQFSSATYSITEGLADSGVNPAATITVTLSGPSAGPASVDYATSSGTATGGASCTAGIDFINTSGTLNFAAGETSKTFSVTTCVDAVDETDETVNLALTNPVGVTLGTPNTAVLTIVDNDGPASPVTVTATAGTTGPTNYNTVKEAFDAINAGTHQGAVTVSINQNTTETASAVLNASGGTSSYTSVLVRPTAVVTVSGSITGAIIKLNGADNVTIDGRIGGTGTNRDLSVINNQSAAATAAIWVASAGAGAGATNNVIRNLELACGANQSTGVLATYGIIMSGATITLTANGDDNDNNAFIANRVIRARYGIATRGNPTNLNIGTLVTDNIIGPAAFGADEIGKAGIFLQADSGAVVGRNTVQFVGGLFANTTSGADRVGIAIGVENWASAPTTLAGSGYTVTRNVIHDIIEERTFSALGILLSATNGASPTDNLVANNFIYNVNTNGTAGDAAVGIGIGAGNGDRVVFNSVRMAGDSDPSAGAATPTQINVNLRVANTPTNLTVKNNSLYNDMFSSSAPTLQSANIQLPTATFAFGTGGLNNNNYYFPVANTTARTGAIGTTSLPTVFHTTLAQWQAAVAPQDANSIQADPQYVSPTDLHIALGSPNVNAGATGTGVLNDIDFQVRDAMPDIGADEPNGATAPANDIAATAILTPAPGSTLINGTSTTPQARFYNAGSATQTNVSVQFTITGPGGYTYTNMQTIASIGSDETVTVTFATAPMFTTAGTYMMTASVLTPDSNTGNDSVSGSFTVINPLSGTVTVGTGGTFTSLTNPGGLFELLNTAGASGNVTAEIISDLTAETGAVALNQLPGGFGLTIKPTGAARVISGTSAASSGLIILHGADNVTIDGSLSGGTDRSLTITNNQATTGIVIWMRSPAAGNGATNNTIKNSILNGAPGPNSTTVAGILTGSSVTLGGDAEAPNSNNTIQNNAIYRVQNSCYLRGGTVAANFDQNWVVTGNDLGSAVVNDNNIFRGMLIGNAANFTITNNNVQGIRSTTTTAAAMSGIQLALLLSNGTVTGNKVTNIKNVSGTGTGAHGISIIATSTASNVTIANNFVSDITALGSATIASNGHGIAFLSLAPGGSGYKLYHNSVNLNTDQGSAQTSAAMFIAATFNVAGAIDARNNIFANTQTTGSRYAVYSLAPATVFGTINYNDYFAQNVGFIGGSARVTLADWQTATGQDANSKAIDPLFVSGTDLHLQAVSPMRDMGVAGTGITVDIDGQPRDVMPDIGADELIGPAPMPGSLQFSSSTYSVGENGPVATITVTRTGGSDGTVTVQYATSNGTATGGATCSAGVDYQNTSGTLTFLNGETSKTFTVPICEDSADEPDETVNLALSNPTGGAVLGSPNTAVLTIVDNDVTPGTFAINDVRVREGNTGTVMATFTVTYTGPAVPVSVQYATMNGTAIAGLDYVATSGTLFFNAPPPVVDDGGVPTQTQTINVQIIPELVKEANETFFVNLSNPTGATIADGQGVGIIIDEDRAYTSDFDRDLISDFSVWRPSDGKWYVLLSESDVPKIVEFGTSGDIPVPGDYDGDGIADFAIFRPSTGNWTLLRSATKSQVTVAFGQNGDKPVQGDYDGDGKTDLAVFRPSTSTWWILRSTNGSAYAVAFGISTDRPVQGDYDGDFKTDVAVYRDGVWYIMRSSDSTVQIVTWGLASDKPMPGDYDGDGKYDVTVYRNGAWWTLNSLTGTSSVVNFGLASDIPAPADYDADGTTDRAVFRPSTGDWYVFQSSNNAVTGVHWGTSGDIPVPAAYFAQ